VKFDEPICTGLLYQPCTLLKWPHRHILWSHDLSKILFQLTTINFQTTTMRHVFVDDSTTPYVHYPSIITRLWLTITRKGTMWSGRYLVTSLWETNHPIQNMLMACRFVNKRCIWILFCRSVLDKMRFLITWLDIAIWECSPSMEFPPLTPVRIVCKISGTCPVQIVRRNFLHGPHECECGPLHKFSQRCSLEEPRGKLTM
jgi:hypothetical protein